MAIGDIWEFVMRGSYHAQLVVNVFHYKATTADAADTDAMMAAFVSDVLTPIAVVQGGQMSWTQLELKQITGGGDYGILPITPPIAGTQSGEDLPPETCFTFRFQRLQLGRRHGYKRICGVTEGNQAAGVAVGGILTYLDDAADAMKADIVPGAGPTLRPGVLHRMLNGQPVVPPVFQDIASVLYSHIGTQNSRKYGRGA